MEKVVSHSMEKQGIGETYTFHIQRNGEGWIGWIQEIPEVTVEEGTREKLVNTLTSEFKRTLIEYEIQAEMWDKQFEEDVKAGRLDKFAEEAIQDFQEGKCEEIEVTLASI